MQSGERSRKILRLYKITLQNQSKIQQLTPTLGSFRWNFIRWEKHNIRELTCTRLMVRKHAGHRHHESQDAKPSRVCRYGRRKQPTFMVAHVRLERLSCSTQGEEVKSLRECFSIHESFSVADHSALNFLIDSLCIFRVQSQDKVTVKPACSRSSQKRG